MRKFLIGLLSGIILSTTGIILAVSLPVNLTQAQIDVIDWKWNSIDPSHIQFSTVNFFLANELSLSINEWKNQRAKNREGLLGSPIGYFCVNTWGTLNSSQQNVICTGTLLEKNSCTPCDVNGN